MHPLIAAEQAKVPEFLKPFVSIESLIDAARQKLISKLAQNGRWTKQEHRDYDALTLQRTERMLPAGCRRPRR
jgi:hypothetical protein